MLPVNFHSYAVEVYSYNQSINQSINQSLICIRPMVHIKEEEKVDNKKKK